MISFGTKSKHQLIYSSKKKMSEKSANNLKGYEIHVEFGCWGEHIFHHESYPLAIFLRKVEGNKAPKLLSSSSFVSLRVSLKMKDDIEKESNYNESDYVIFNKNPIELNKSGQGNVNVTFKKLSYSNQCQLKFEIIGNCNVKPYFSHKFKIM